LAARSSACRRRAPRPKAARVARSLRMYNTLVERCFVDCVDSFRRKDLESAEEKVVYVCCKRTCREQPLGVGPRVR